ELRPIRTNNPHGKTTTNIFISQVSKNLYNFVVNKILNMKRILGLDLGTNSIGWALVHQDFEIGQGKILGMGSRIIPMTQDIKDEFVKGNSISQTADRYNFRCIRRLRERYLLRRERLHRILNVLGFLPKHYAGEIDFKRRLGQFLEETEPKIAWKKN